MALHAPVRSAALSTLVLGALACTGGDPVALGLAAATPELLERHCAEAIGAPRVEAVG